MSRAGRSHCEQAALGAFLRREDQRAECEREWPESELEHRPPYIVRYCSDDGRQLRSQAKRRWAENTMTSDTDNNESNHHYRSANMIARGP